jgi:hypothetical protein
MKFITLVSQTLSEISEILSPSHKPSSPKLRNQRKAVRVLLTAIVLAVSFSTLTAFREPTQKAIPVTDYTGNEICLSCHQEQKSFLGTAHHLTSRNAGRDTIAGKFNEGQNILKTAEPELHYRMEARNDSFYQTAVLGTAPDTATISKRFDLVVGSGRKGQTYLYWEGDRLYQLPVSYWTELGKWVQSPGYDLKFVNFNRPVPPRCLECHASSFESLADADGGNRYSKTNYVLGISCERCHGPGKEHVALHTPETAKVADQRIVNPAKLSRERQTGLCALCHGGIGVAKAPAFSYTAGQNLEDYLRLETPSPTEAVDVHGSQVALLERSRCFKSSNMTCSTCHNTHVPQRDVADLSGRCLTCHKSESCGLFPKMRQKLEGKCVNCHLPKQKSDQIVSSHEGLSVRPEVRNHWIKVYPENRTP